MLTLACILPVFVYKIKKNKKNQSINNKKDIIESKNLGILYKHINSRPTHRTGIAPLCEPDVTIIIEYGQNANELIA